MEYPSNHQVDPMSDVLLHDSLGDVRVPAGALYGPQTQRAIENFAFSDFRFPRPFLAALGLIKKSAAEVNGELGLLDPDIAAAIAAAAEQVENGAHDAQFPLDIFQTGSGTSTNMNANEVIATLASRICGKKVHPNDHVNLGQSSNDVIPAAIHISAASEVQTRLLPALTASPDAIASKARTLDHVVKTGRTHLMDAVPIRMSQELGGWEAQLRAAAARIESALPRVFELAARRNRHRNRVERRPAFRRAGCRADREALGPSRSPAARICSPAISSQDASLGAERAVARIGGVAAENRQRSAPDEQRPGRRTRGNFSARAAARQQYHARKSESRDSRSRRHDLRAGRSATTRPS